MILKNSTIDEQNKFYTYIDGKNCEGDFYSFLKIYWAYESGYMHGIPQYINDALESGYVAGFKR